MRRASVVAAAMALAALAGGGVPASAAGPDTATVSVSPVDVHRGGVVTFRGQCAVADRSDLSAVVTATLPAAAPGGPYTFQRTVPLVSSVEFAADLDVPVTAPSGLYGATLTCVHGTTTGPTATATPGFTVDVLPAVAPPPAPTVHLTGLSSTFTEIRLTGTCPASTPAATSVLVITTVRPPTPTPSTSITEGIAVHADGTFGQVIVLGGLGGTPSHPPHAEPAGLHDMVVFCQAGTHFLGDVTTTFNVTAPPATTATTATATTAVTSTTAPVAGSSAPAAQPVAATASFTG
ncbi:MAG: hypothetical protein JWN46_102 [Acidimicrobiales bacterium]|nr:hypothetical protein [Acidimicrobiales bacterium]